MIVRSLPSQQQFLGLNICQTPCLMNNTLCMFLINVTYNLYVLSWLVRSLCQSCVQGWLWPGLSLSSSPSVPLWERSYNISSYYFSQEVAEEIWQTRLEVTKHSQCSLLPICSVTQLWHLWPRQQESLRRTVSGFQSPPAPPLVREVHFQSSKTVKKRQIIMFEHS